MSAAEPAPLPPPSQSTQTRAGPRPPRNRRPRGDTAPNPSGDQTPAAQTVSRRGGRGAGRGRATRGDALALRPASVAPSSSQPQSVEPSSADVSANEQSGARQRQPRRARGGKVQEHRTVNGRAFGGRLTQDVPLQADGQLQADAPAFVPGQQHAAQKQEMKCNASKAGEGNLSKALACNDECARLERNRRLALALNINQSTHVDGGDHIPYSNETLALFQEHVKWAQTQEREFRVFAAADDEKRFRFKPMPPHQRSFLHLLAEDFGLDSESMDPEPHRHVAIWKTPRFVTAPNKTLAECVRIRMAQRAAAGKDANGSDGEASKKGKSSNEVGEPYNSFLIMRPRFGLTVEEVRAELMTVAAPTLPVQFDIEFLPNEEVIVRGMSRAVNEQGLEQMLKDLKAPLASAIAGKGYGSVQLCHTDASLNIHRRESDGVTSDGWSRVAAKGAAPRRINPQASIGGRNTFSALSGNKITFAKKKEKKPVVAEPVDDWEAAEAEEEEKEKVVNESSTAGEEQGSAPLDDAVADELDTRPSLEATGDTETLDIVPRPVEEASLEPTAPQAMEPETANELTERSD
ncbi:hypothetical protein MBLNU459_g0336t1 [Dothideomycetes sp. NU459]